MTMAAGIVAADGILLFADTLYTDGQTKDYREKIFPWESDGAAVSFAISGHGAIARMVVDECRDALSALSSIKTSPLSISTMLRAVRPIVKSVYEQYVDTRPAEERYASDFSLLVAISNATEGSRLYTSVRTAIASVDNFECIGSGRQIGRYVIEPTYHSSMTISETQALAVFALAAAKERVDGVDGRSQMQEISGGHIISIETKNDSLWEKYALDFRQASSRLLLDLGNLDDDAFSDRLATFCKEVESLRRWWNKTALDFLTTSFLNHVDAKRKERQAD